jgi:S-(hydroxymethyl)glutathione dehydrogenase/alcohol dehydrogenase
MKMKAAVCYEFGKPLSVEEVDIDSPRPNEVLIRLGAVAICHSDLHVIGGDLGNIAPTPFIQGHETAGYVTEVGENVTSIKPGDAVVATLILSCRRCHFCVNGMPWLCEKQGEPWPTDRIHNKEGQGITQNVFIAGFAEYVLVDESQIAKIPQDFPIDKAALLACGVITGFGAVVNRARVRPMQSVVVIGVGGVGLNSLQGAAISGANPIIAVDISDYKLEASKKFGATHTVRADSEDAVDQVKQLTSGRGADYVFITVGGNAAAIEQGIAMTGPRGMTVVVGLARAGSTVTTPPFLDGEKMYTSCMMGSTIISEDIPRLIDLYKAGRLKLDELITNRFSLDKINEAIESTARGEALRNIIVFPK